MEKKTKKRPFFQCLPFRKFSPPPISSSKWGGGGAHCSISGKPPINGGHEALHVIVTQRTCAKFTSVYNTQSKNWQAQNTSLYFGTYIAWLQEFLMRTFDSSKVLINTAALTNVTGSAVWLREVIVSEEYNELQVHGVWLSSGCALNISTKNETFLGPHMRPLAWSPERVGESFQLTRFTHHILPNQRTCGSILSIFRVWNLVLGQRATSCPCTAILPNTENCRNLGPHMRP